MDDCNLNEKSSTSDISCNIEKIWMPKTFLYKQCQLMFALHLILATLHMRFTMSIERDKQNGDTTYNILL